ncbi:hypothetical protein DM01DRAFT_1339821 [Hesseltinella vesiculosa]|uniref:Uncharacterized protein n=1 Tax=Hesseltinella vesiculosa TaxID=101127 RepID=A0A1X2G5U7_9FUNG|nr:hypothetical protein DM01DRAFT_1339821 [Hesseltinella vesiculosa]
MFNDIKSILKALPVEKVSIGRARILQLMMADALSGVEIILTIPLAWMDAKNYSTMD